MSSTAMGSVSLSDESSDTVPFEAGKAARHDA